MELKKLTTLGVGVLILACLCSCSNSLVAQKNSANNPVSSENHKQSETINLRIKTSDDLKKVLSDKDLGEIMLQYGVSNVKIDPKMSWDYDELQKSVPIQYLFFDKDNNQVGGMRLEANLYDHTGIEIHGAYEQGDFKFHIQNSGQAQELLESYLNSDYYQKAALPNEERGRATNQMESYVPFVDLRIENGAFIYDQYDTKEQSTFSSKIFLNGSQVLSMDLLFEPNGSHSMEERKVSPAILETILAKMADNIQK